MKAPVPASFKRYTKLSQDFNDHGILVCRGSRFASIVSISADGSPSVPQSRDSFDSDNLTVVRREHNGDLSPVLQDVLEAPKRSETVRIPAAPLSSSQNTLIVSKRIANTHGGNCL
ncbi:hypothetical protein CLAIMM_12555 [Cladophialophora immunda]|nr:hypothetical protein CLAIMM_12555 [Cladophialophora immunda]